MTETLKTAQRFDIFSGGPERLAGIKVLLIYPPVRLSKMPMFPPVGLLSLAAVLEKSGAIVEILDLNMMRLSFANLKKELDSREFDIIGVGGMATVYYYIKLLVKYLKYKYPKVPVIGGGTVSSGSPDVVMANVPLDALVIGEGEPVIIDVIDVFINKKDISTIQGVVYRKDNDVVKTDPRSRMENLDDLPFPAYHLIDLEKYISNSFVYKKKKNIVSEARIKELNLDKAKSSRPVMLFTKRGCPYKCDFCYRNFGQRVISHSVKYVLDHMRFLEEKYNTINFSIEDETFNIDKKWIIEFCDALIAEKRNYIIGIDNGLRANLIDDDIVLKMKEAGFCSIGVGIESFYNPSLKDMVKLQTADIVVSAIETINKHGFYLASAQFLYGYPSDNAESMAVNVEMCKKLGLKSAGFAIPCPYPGTALYTRAVIQGHIKDEEGWLMELADKDISDRVINMSGKSDKFLQKQITKAKDQIIMYFMRKQFPVLGHMLTVVQAMGRWVGIDSFELIKGIKDGLISIFVYHKRPGKMLKSGGANDTYIKDEAFEMLKKGAFE